MRPHPLRLCLFGLLIFLLGPFESAVAFQQKKNEKQKPGQIEEQQKESDVIKVETSLVTVPVVVSDRNNVYIPDLHREEFSLLEDGVKQEIVFFAATKEPFHVVLMLDTSASTQEKIGQIQRAAISFTHQLQPADRVKVISFDDRVHELSAFTGDRVTIEKAIASTRPGEGTKLYDAVSVALKSLARVEGRKAIVIFTDGVDWRSASATYDENLASVEESGVIVYPIRYETRADTEALVRSQQDQFGSASDIGLILGGPPIGTTPPTIPGSGGTPTPQRRPGAADDPYRLPIPPIMLPPTSRYPGGNRYPDDRSSGRIPYPDTRNPQGDKSEDRFPDTRAPSTRRTPTDSVSVMLDNLYSTADRYLIDLARSSGGKLHRADTLGGLPIAFESIAAELRQQYSLGYYPVNSAKDGKFRKVQVKVSRPEAIARSRPGYRAPRVR